MGFNLGIRYARLKVEDRVGIELERLEDTVYFNVLHLLDESIKHSLNNIVILC